MTNDCVVDPHTTLEYKVPKPFVNGVAVKPMTLSFGLFFINSLISLIGITKSDNK
jgi:hypothetical protein